MIYILAALVPPLGLLLNGQPFSAIFSVILIVFSLIFGLLFFAPVLFLLPSLFGELNLHRIEAACIPSNAPSIRVLEKCGFSREGLARRYLCINGVWQDHLLFGLLHEDFRG